ncbi:hypothetical protein PVAP13_8NG030702 [Panicum virgatum]|uniref:Secreted protein n=1 Tax=Panicum virgatum TaxID=38727 RepID=A0A8T0P4Z1_PANVG|nr:hypothetical protein PVAP13_8NG030702 [Panicum virgatum]
MNRKGCVPTMALLHLCWSIILFVQSSVNINIPWLLYMQGVRYATSRMGYAKAMPSRTFPEGGITQLRQCIRSLASQTV